jgi:hypothetical protein
MKEKTKYWLAGLLEGEGSFLSGPPSAPNQPRISLQMTDKDVVERVKEIFGVNYVHERKRKKAWKKTYRIMVKGSNAVDIMREIRPLMGDRRKTQIDEALESTTLSDGCRKSDISQSDYSRDTVSKIWEEIQESNKTLKEIANQNQVKYQFVKDLNNGRTWSHLTGK